MIIFLKGKTIVRSGKTGPLNCLCETIRRNEMSDKLRVGILGGTGMVGQ